jgi:hypothetical protein
VRFDLSGQLGTSENTATRLLGAHLVEDAVGRAKNLETPFSVSEMQRKVQLGFETRFMQEHTANFKAWATTSVSTGPSVSLAKASSGRASPRQCATWTRTISSIRLCKQAAASRSCTRTTTTLLANPGKLDGTTRRPVLSPDVPQNENYVPRIVSREKFQEWSIASATGRSAASSLTLCAASTRTSITIWPDRIGRGWYKRIRDVQAGQELNGGRALFGEDVDGLRHALVEATNMSNDEASAFIARFQKEPGEGGVARTKYRTLMDENFHGVLEGQRQRRGNPRPPR